MKPKFKLDQIHKGMKIRTSCTFRECDEATVLGVNHDLKDVKYIPLWALANPSLAAMFLKIKARKWKLVRLNDRNAIEFPGMVGCYPSVTQICKELNRLENQVASLKNRRFRWNRDVDSFWFDIIGNGASDFPIENWKSFKELRGPDLESACAIAYTHFMEKHLTDPGSHGLGRIGMGGCVPDHLDLRYSLLDERDYWLVYGGSK